MVSSRFRSNDRKAASASPALVQIWLTSNSSRLIRWSPFWSAAQNSSSSPRKAYSRNESEPSPSESFWANCFLPDSTCSGVCFQTVNSWTLSRSYLVVDDTLLHKRGKHVYALGWFRDAVASTAKRVATASGNHWVVVGLAIRIPGTEKIYCLPIHMKLHLPGKGQPSEATLARQMLQDVLAWFPDRKLVLLGDGAYSTKNLLADLPERAREGLDKRKARKVP